MKVKQFFAGLLAGLAAAGAAIVAVLAALNRDARDRYQITEEVHNEIEQRAQAAADEKKAEVMAASPHDVVASLPTDAQGAIDSIERTAVNSALARARELSRAHADGGGAREPGQPGSA
jgi:ABC-type protease/lipase transport system fused ATPase/permease subunit